MNSGMGNRNGTQVIRPKQQTKKQQQKQQKKVEKPQNDKCPRKGGVKIGQSKEDQNKWRCLTCKRLNDIQIYQCTFCGDPKFDKDEKQPQEDRPLQANQ